MQSEADAVKMALSCDDDIDPTQQTFQDLLLQQRKQFEQDKQSILQLQLDQQTLQQQCNVLETENQVLKQAKQGTDTELTILRAESIKYRELKERFEQPLTLVESEDEDDEDHTKRNSHESHQQIQQLKDENKTLEFCFCLMIFFSPSPPSPSFEMYLFIQMYMYTYTYIYLYNRQRVTELQQQLEQLTTQRALDSSDANTRDKDTIELAWNEREEQLRQAMEQQVQQFHSEKERLLEECNELRQQNNTLQQRCLSIQEGNNQISQQLASWSAKENNKGHSHPRQSSPFKELSCCFFVFFLLLFFLHKKKKINK
ncbi:hypothetical protein RFI_23134 [Reticulomyxa filosa]|uniref:Viral A-type inclusion protein n=1 Tax=Reticulomyxa filosa TaxID=46433 RepID=X6ML96_RETFI|nr:hypothetical protein RFI_23134 [Reticulomyxa filosa]|eukprot:ETO14232.1 hypothetical protein RFI_23134 [Reticulomyxa filosa]